MCVVCVVCPGEVSRLVGAIKVSRTLGQSQLNFAHTFFSFVIADESGLVSGFAPLLVAAMLQGFGARLVVVASPNVAFAGELVS